MLSLIALATLLLAARVHAVLPNFTGNVKTDFPTDPNISQGENIPFTNGAGLLTLTTWDSENGEGDDDVGLPREFPLTVFAGWDVDSVRFAYDSASDTLAIGIDCIVVCGDADGDGNSGGTGSILAGNGGEDLPQMQGTESFVLAIDFGQNGSTNKDGLYDIVIGYPSNIRPDGTPAWPCTNANLFGADCFGIYLFDNHPSGFSAAIQPQNRFIYDTSSGILPHPATDRNANPSTARPDIEWTIEQFTVLRTNKLGVPAFNGEWSFDFALFAGSFQDDGIGEDLFPNSGLPGTASFPCSQFDVCDVCFGNGQSCLDCAGIPNGPNVVDVCNICGGDGTTCRDCAGTPFGTATYDACDVCNGNGQSCVDCAGVPNGNAVLDVCNICNGNGQSCLDCAGTPFGNAVVDRCGVCGGNGLDCLDCAGTPNGNATTDVCGVCNGDGTSCLDCNGTPNGGASYDVCNVCGGDGTSCLDCNGVANGNAVYDACDICGGDGSTCLPPPMCAEFPADGEILHLRETIHQWEDVLSELREHLHARTHLCESHSHDDSSTSDRHIYGGHHQHANFQYIKCMETVKEMQYECEKLEGKIADVRMTLANRKASLAAKIESVWAKIKTGELILCEETTVSTSSSSSHSSSHHHHHHHHHHGHGHHHHGTPVAAGTRIEHAHGDHALHAHIVGENHGGHVHHVDVHGHSHGSDAGADSDDCPEDEDSHEHHHHHDVNPHDHDGDNDVDADDLLKAWGH